jgi:hypothetical protein
MAGFFRLGRTQTNHRPELWQNLGKQTLITKNDIRISMLPFAFREFTPWGGAP